MWEFWKFLGFSLLGVLIVIGLVVTFSLAGIYLVLIVVAFYGWVAFAFCHYRYLRQEEVFQLLKAAGEAQTPVAPALWAYLLDRPSHPWHDFWVALLQFFLLPGYYWAWHRQHAFDKKVERVAWALEAGFPLHRALREAPGVVSRE